MAHRFNSLTNIKVRTTQLYKIGVKHIDIDGKSSVSKSVLSRTIQVFSIRGRVVNVKWGKPYRKTSDTIDKK